MGTLSRSARLYLLGTMTAGAVLMVWQLGQLPVEALGLALAVGVLAGLAQIFKVDGPTARSSYNISWVAYGFAFVLWGAPGAILVIVLAHLMEWVKHRYSWYIQCFNIAQFVVAACVAMWVRDALQMVAASPLIEALAILGASAAFTGVNHWLIGIVLMLARGQSFKESGVFERLTLSIDATLFVMGVVGAFVWQVNPFIASLAAVPLYLIYTTLRVPALQRQTQIDPKTGLYNSKFFSQALETELARCERFDRPLTVVMADLDLLRNINNTYGHLAGDACLVRVAGLLKKSVREYDIVSRFGGEEFAILMPETTYEQASPHIEEIRAAIEATGIEISTSATPLRVTMSFGIAQRERFGQTSQEIVHGADLAVYQAKLAGRNRICRYTASDAGTVLTTPPVAAQPPAAQAAPQPTPAAALPAITPAAPMAPPPAGPPESPTPRLQPRPRWAIQLYIAGVAVVAAGLSVLTLSAAAPPEWFGWALFVALAVLAEGLAIDIYVRNTSVSTAAAPMIAGSILFGPIGAVALGLAVAITAWIKNRSPFSRFLFNAANHTIATLFSVGVFQLVQSVAGGVDSHALEIAGAVLAGGAMYLSTTTLLAFVVDLSTGEPVGHVWAERFRWLWPYYLALGALAYVLASVYTFGGWLSVVVALVPLLILRFSQVQYLDHTKTLVAELRASNLHLSQRADQISSLNEELLLALSQAIDVRDPDVFGHSENVARYAVLVAQQMGLPAERVDLVRKAGLLHDIGKLGIPESILFKPARLTEAEYQVIQRHAELGASLVGNAPSLKALVPFIRHHHERFDGRGYPARMAGHAIPLESRILSVADTVEAMASDRPYRQGQSQEVILQELLAHSGTQFDPEVVAAFVSIIRRGGKTVVVNSARHLADQSERHDADPEAPRPQAPVGARNAAGPGEAARAPVQARFGGTLSPATAVGD